MPAQPLRDESADLVARRLRGLLRRSDQQSMPSLVPVAGWALLLVTLVLLWAQGTLVAQDPVGRTNSFRDTGVAILSGLVGLRVAMTPGRHPVGAALAAVAGGCLLLNGFLAQHHGTGLIVVEIACGAVAVLAAIAVWSTGPATPRDSRPGRGRPGRERTDDSDTEKPGLVRNPVPSSARRSDDREPRGERTSPGEPEQHVHR